MIKSIGCVTMLSFLMIMNGQVFAFHPDIYSPRVPKELLEIIQEIENPYPATPKRIRKGQEIFFGKGLCVTCHSISGKAIKFLSHAPRDFADAKWQDVRTDGELMWILKNGSPGTGMPIRVGKGISEEEGWYVIHYIRSFLKK